MSSYPFRIIAIKDDLVTIEAASSGSDAPALMKNEVVLVCPRISMDEHGQPQEKLKAEVLRIRGNQADAQVFEDTRGVSVGDGVELTGTLLSLKLGPGLLGKVYDGLQNPLELIAKDHGFFLPRGYDIFGLNEEKKWAFSPKVRVGDKLKAGGVVGSVQEGRFAHKIMIPFAHVGEAEITWVQEGSLTVGTPVARYKDDYGAEHDLTMVQDWPVRRPLAGAMLRNKVNERLFPQQPLITTLRLIDTFFPVAMGGTACIPGPFGAGKTVLQNLISRYSAVDIVIIVACGERAGEVVETITEFPHLEDPKTGGPLMDRTIIICNTSSMPVAAREASIYTGITLGEYYRQMGYNVLLIADSTSRWAQAMRETSGRMEEIPGEEAFPAYLDSAIKGIYERAGIVRTTDGAEGSLTMIGTVSPAGGNFEEPVTQSTLRTVKTFLALSYARAYKRFYPAVDPLISWSRYTRQLKEHYDTHIETGWTERVERLLELFQQGDSIQQMMQVTGEEGITIEDFVTLQKAILLDMVYMQQDAFDDVDVSTPIERQKQTLGLLDRVIRQERAFADKEEARTYFTKLTGLFKNMNYAAEGTPQHKQFWGEIEGML